MKQIKFESVPAGSRFKTDAGTFTKLERPGSSGFGCDQCDCEPRKIWNAWNGNNTVHICLNETVELLE